MKKFFTLVASVLMLIGSAQAQQIKGDFEVWEDCYPDGGENKVGQQPVGWTASNVFQIIVGKEFVFPAAGYMGTGAKIMNDFVGMMGIGANAPAFVTLGKMWVFADMMGMLTGDDKSDGGVHGGVEFNYRPDSLVLYYKRKLGTEKPNEPGKVLIYLWKGTFKSKVVSAHDMNEEGTELLDPVYSEIDDQDRAILGRQEVIPADTKGDGILIGSAEYTIDGAVDDWTRLSIPIKYVEGENGKLIPEKMNIVFSGCNYWVRADIGKDNTLWVDDASLIYNAKLSSLKVGDKDIIGFNEDTLNYLLPYNYNDRIIEAKAYGKDAVVTINTIKNGADEIVKTITVTCTAEQTADATKTYVYTLTFKGESVGEITAPGDVDNAYGDIFDLAFTSTNNEVPMTYVISNEEVLKYDAETKKFHAIKAGSTTVTARQDKEGLLSAISAPVSVNIAKAPLTMTLEAWCQRGTNLSFTSNSSTDLTNNGIKFGIDFKYEGLKNEDGKGEFIDILNRVLDGKGIWVSKGTADKKNEVIGAYRPIVLSLSGGSDTLRTYSSTNYEITIVNPGAEIRKKQITVYPYYISDGASHSLRENNVKESFAVGSKIDWKFNYSSFAYNEKDSIMKVLGSDTVTVSCSKDPDTAVAGEEIAVTVNLPETAISTYEFLTYTGLSVEAKKTYSFENMELGTKKYGDERFAVPFVVKKEDGTKVDYSLYPSVYGGPVAIQNDTTVVINGAGDLYLTLEVSGDDDYASSKRQIDLSIAKALLTVQAKDVEVILGQSAPETFKLEYKGLVNKDDSAKVFIKAPSVTLEKNIPADAKAGDIIKLIVEPGESANYDLTAVNGKLRIIIDGINVTETVNKEGLAIIGYYMADPDTVLATGMNPSLSFVESGPYWQFDRYIKKGQEKNLANLVLTFDVVDGYMCVLDGGIYYLINPTTGDQVNIRVKDVPVLVYDTPITEETSTLKTIHVADPGGVLSEDKAPDYTFQVASNGDATVVYTYYVKQGKTDKESLKTLVPTFDCTEDYAWLEAMGGDFTEVGSLFMFYNGDYSKVGTSLKVNFEEYSTREPITKITETLNYAFNNNSDWINVNGKYDNPTDWDSSNPSGQYLGGMYPVTKAVEGDNGYVKLSTLSPGYDKPNALIPNIVSGSLFYGAFKLVMTSPLKSTRFGLPIEGGYVSKVSGKYKYASGETYYNNYTPAEPNKKDNWSVLVALYEVGSYDETLDGTNISDLNNSTNPIIAYGFLLGNESSDWIDFECPVYLMKEGVTIQPDKLYKAAVVFSSSVDGANYNGAVGSELCLDDLIVTYSTEAPAVNPNSIDHNAVQSAIAIYPNPATTVINIVDAEAGSVYNIRNIAGGLVRNGALNEAQINVSDLAEGVYFLEISGQTLKFIKK